MSGCVILYETLLTYTKCFMSFKTNCLIFFNFVKQEEPYPYTKQKQIVNAVREKIENLGKSFSHIISEKKVEDETNKNDQQPLVKKKGGQLKQNKRRDSRKELREWRVSHRDTAPLFPQHAIETMNSLRLWQSCHAKTCFTVSLCVCISFH